MKATIEDLKEEKTYYKRNKDAFGNVTREPYQAKVKRPVNVVKSWARFGHYLIDFAILYALNFIIGFTIAIVDPYSEFFQNPLYSYAVSWSLLIGYYMICESTMQRTVGKFATNSVVINEYAEKPANDQLLGRSFARLVPFEAFSCLSDRGWHDKWSKTYVVKTSERDELKRLLASQEGHFLSDSDELLD